MFLKHVSHTLSQKHGHISKEKIQENIRASKGSKKKGQGRHKRSFIVNSDKKWSKCMIPYQFDASFENMSLATPGKSYTVVLFIKK